MELREISDFKTTFGKDKQTGPAKTTLHIEKLRWSSIQKDIEDVLC